MPGASLLDDYEAPREPWKPRRPRRWPRRKKRSCAFGKVTRIIGRENAMRVFTEGNYLPMVSTTRRAKKMKPEMITRLIMRKLSA